MGYFEKPDSQPDNQSGSQPPSQCSDQPDCSQVLEQVYAYLHAQIPDDQREQLRQHLERCGECMDEYSVESQVLQVLKRSCPCSVPAPQQLRQRVISLLSDATQVQVSSFQASVSGVFGRINFSSTSVRTNTIFRSDELPDQ